MTDKIYIGSGFNGSSQNPQYLTLKYANRHGLIAGATGTGKTVTLQKIAEEFSKAGIPVFCADIKGDLSGICQPAGANPKVAERIKQLGITNYTPAACPTIFWDVFGKQGHPIRTTISEMGPLILSRLMGLNDTQEGVLNICFSVADAQGLLLLDLKDLRAMLVYVADNAAEISREYGNVAGATIAAIQRELLSLERQGAESFFGEPALDVRDLMRTSRDGQGYVNVLAADELIQSPKLYATFLLWLLSEIYEDLPESGDLDKPKLAFFFDEAHLLFNDAPKILLEKVEQVVRLIRSKGVGVYFITQNPQDVPETVLGQLGNRFQHTLRAFTPKDQKAVKVAAQTFRANSAFKTEEAITNLGVGEALVSTLENGGVPSVVERTFIAPPTSQIGAITPSQRAEIVKNSPLAGFYDRLVDRESAYEKLNSKVEKQPQQIIEERKTQNAPRKNARMGYGETLAKQVIRTVGSQVGRQIVRGILGSLLR